MSKKKQREGDEVVFGDPIHDEPVTATMPLPNGERRKKVYKERVYRVMGKNKANGQTVAVSIKPTIGQCKRLVMDILPMLQASFSEVWIERSYIVRVNIDTGEAVNT